MRTLKLNLISIVLLMILSLESGCSAGSSLTLKPGDYDNYTLLPNGWKLTPAGSQVQVDELPLNMVVTKDEKYAILSNSGYDQHSLSVVDISAEKEVQRTVVDKTWRGLAFNADESKLFVSGGYNNLIYIYNFNGGTLTLEDSLIIGKRYPEEKVSISGLDYLPSKNLLLAGAKDGDSLFVCDMSAKKILKMINLGSRCYDVKINHTGTTAYASLWEDSAIAEINLTDFEIVNKIKTGSHPTEILITKNDKKLFTPNANDNSVSVIDLEKKEETEKLISSLNPGAPRGSTPNSVALNKGETRLYIANADNNYLAVFDVSESGSSKSMGFIPTGWYPTVVRCLSTGSLLAANGKGLSSAANPEFKDSDSGYIGGLFNGTLSIISNPGEEELEEYSKQVYENTPGYLGGSKSSNLQDVIPAEHNGRRSEKIKHVFYIIKENRSFDQVYGDLPEGNCDTSLCLFGRIVTPNQHRLAQEFTIFDNFYVNAEVSADGHNWSDAAYATDYVEKSWPTNYGGRGGDYDFEAATGISRPASGYIWNAVLEKGLIPRVYGEYTAKPDTSKEYYTAEDERISGHVCHDFPGWNLSISDLTRYKAWEKDFTQFEKDGNLPDLNLIYLPNDHTMGTHKGSLSPKAYVAQNDYALGLLVDKISHSRYWKESIIFVLEDDAQAGPDHVDAHRSGVLVVSPYVKRHSIDHTMYSTSSVLKTIELVLGLKPMTQFDLAAAPMLEVITDEPEFAPFNHTEPTYNIYERNPDNAYGAVRSGQFDFTKPDAIPDREMSLILWKSIKGGTSLYPAPVRNAFVKINSEED